MVTVNSGTGIATVLGSSLRNLCFCSDVCRTKQRGATECYEIGERNKTLVVYKQYFMWLYFMKRTDFVYII
jgi:hypothetical protein